MDKDFIMNRLFEHMNDVGNKKIIYIALQGSQNYKLDTEKSDIDTKAFVLPSFRDIVLNKKPDSYTHEMENLEHCDVKDIRLMVDCFRKQNINFLEVLFTEYYSVMHGYENEINRLRAMREEIAHYNNYAAMNCMAGMAMEKFKALTHPYPTIKWKIDKWGYDGKQLHHILRMENFIDAFFNGASFKTCLTTFHINEQGVLMAAKENLYSLLDAERMARKSMEHIDQMKEDYMKKMPLLVNEEVKEEMDNIVYDIMVKSIKEEFEEKENPPLVDWDITCNFDNEVKNEE